MATGRLRTTYAGLPGVLPEVEALCGAGDELVVELAPGRPDLRAVDALARMALAARRSRARLVLRAPDGALHELVELMGLCEALGVEPWPPPEDQP